MSVRNIFRNPGRTFFIFLGIMFAFSLGGMTWAFNDMMDQMLYDQYEKVEKYSAKVALAAPLEAEPVVRELGGFPGVKRAEPWQRSRSLSETSGVKRMWCFWGFPKTAPFITSSTKI